MADEQHGRRFAGRVAVVPGSSANPSIGRSCATRLGREGAAVVINGRDPTTLAATERDLRALGIRVVAVAGSMEDAATPARLVEAAREQFGRIDHLVNTIGGRTSRARSRRWTRPGSSTPSPSIRGPRSP